MNGRNAPMRWNAEITYRTDEGENVVEYFIEEIEDLHDIVEAGPDWNTIQGINLQLIRVHSPDLTVEKSKNI